MCIERLFAGLSCILNLYLAIYRTVLNNCTTSGYSQGFCPISPNPNSPNVNKVVTYDVLWRKCSPLKYLFAYFGRAEFCDLIQSS